MCGVGTDFRYLFFLCINFKSSNGLAARNAVEVAARRPTVRVEIWGEPVLGPQNDSLPDRQGNPLPIPHCLRSVAVGKLGRARGNDLFIRPFIQSDATQGRDGCGA